MREIERCCRENTVLDGELIFIIEVNFVSKSSGRTKVLESSWQKFGVRPSRFLGGRGQIQRYVYRRRGQKGQA